MPPKKRAGRSGGPETTAGTAAGSSPSDAAADEGRTERRRDEPTRADPAASWRVLGIAVLLLAGATLVVGVTMLTLGVYTYDNLNPDGTYTVDQQIGMATAGVTAGTGLAVAGLVTLGLVFVGFRLGRA